MQPSSDVSDSGIQSPCARSLPAKSAPESSSRQHPYLHVGSENKRHCFLSPCGSKLLRAATIGAVDGDEFYEEQATLAGVKLDGNVGVLRICAWPDYQLARVVTGGHLFVLQRHSGDTNSHDSLCAEHRSASDDASPSSSPNTSGSDLALAHTASQSSGSTQRTSELETSSLASSSAQAPPRLRHRPCPAVLIPEGMSFKRWLIESIVTGPGSAEDLAFDGNCAYAILGAAAGLEANEVRLVGYDYADKRLRELWPEVTDERVEEIKAQIFAGGRRGDLGVKEGETIPQSLWMRTSLLGLFAAALERVICAYDESKPAYVLSYLPPTGGFKALREPIGLFYQPGHWRQVWVRDDRPLPPASWSFWGKAAKKRFLTAPTHQLIHAKWQFWAWEQDAASASCGCGGVAP